MGFVSQPALRSYFVVIIVLRLAMGVNAHHAVFPAGSPANMAAARRCAAVCVIPVFELATGHVPTQVHARRYVVSLAQNYPAASHVQSCYPVVIYAQVCALSGAQHSALSASRGNFLLRPRCSLPVVITLICKS